MAQDPPRGNGEGNGGLTLEEAAGKCLLGVHRNRLLRAAAEEDELNCLRRAEAWFRLEEKLRRRGQARDRWVKQKYRSFTSRGPAHRMPRWATREEIDRWIARRQNYDRDAVIARFHGMAQLDLARAYRQEALRREARALRLAATALVLGEAPPPSVPDSHLEDARHLLGGLLRVRQPEGPY